MDAIDQRNRWYLVAIGTIGFFAVVVTIVVVLEHSNRKKLHYEKVTFLQKSIEFLTRERDHLVAFERSLPRRSLPRMGLPGLSESLTLEYIPPTPENRRFAALVCDTKRQLVRLESSIAVAQHELIRISKTPLD